MTEDKELKAMSAVAEAISGLDEAEQARVLAWVASRFNVSIGPTRRGSGSAAADTGNGQEQGEVVFEAFVDLFDKANPKSDAEKAAVAAYWSQVIGGDATWASQPLNSALKDLGYGLGNITDALNSLQERKPAWVRQVSKSGQNRQGRKTYKLTQAGINGVRFLLGRAPEPGEE
jgi:hypothetical protein